MTQLDVLFRYGNPPSEHALLALARVRDVYGIRRMQFNELAHTVRIEYDASRLTEAVVHQLLRRAGLDITETVSLIPQVHDVPPAEPVLPSVAQPSSAPNSSAAAPTQPSAPPPSQAPSPTR